MLKHELETKRLYLTGYNPDVLNTIAKQKTKAEIIQFFGFGETGFEQFMKMHTHGAQTFSISFYAFVLMNKTTNLPIGECGFHSWNAKHKRAELFYYLHHDADKKQGYMSEALEAVIGYGFTKLDLHRIVGMVAPYNTPSVKLLLKNNFTKEGTARQDYVVNGINEDSDCYSLLKHEWKQV